MWAAKCDRVAAMELLVGHGARPDADPYRGTPLTWAAAKGRTGAVRWLLEHGADANQRGTFGGASHGEGVTALHLAAQDNHVEAAQVLIAHGADIAIEDSVYHSTPLGWATHFGSDRVRKFLEGLPPRSP